MSNGGGSRFVYVIYIYISSILMVPTSSLQGTNLILVLLFHTLAFFSQV